MNYLLGIDLGTTGCKAALYDVCGNVLAQSYREYKFILPAKNYVEEDPEDWWVKTIEIIKDIVAQNGDAATNISGIGVSCTNALLAVDSDGVPLMNAIMQLDHRSKDLTDEMKKVVTPDMIFLKTGNRLVSGTVTAPVILWIKRNLPEIYNKTYKFLAPAGFIVNRLTGKFTIDFSRASTTALFNIKNYSWDCELLETFQISRDKLPEIFDSHEVVGYVTKQVAELTSLKEGIPVIAGVMDTVAAGIGIGSNDMTEPFLIMGSVGRICLPLMETVFSDVFLNSCNTSETPYLSMAPINGVGNSMKWFRDVFGSSEFEIAKQKDKSVFDIFSAMAAESELGSKGLIYLPYIAGERSPHWDSCAKGVFFGITTGHQKKEFIRAIMEGVAYALRNNLDIMKSFYKKDIRKLRIGGGCTLSEPWMQIVSDVLNVELVQTDHTECETLGAAILAGVGVGLFSSIQAAGKKIIRETIATIPDYSRHQKYAEYYIIFNNLYNVLSPQFVLVDNIAKMTEPERSKNKLNN